MNSASKLLTLILILVLLTSLFTLSTKSDEVHAASKPSVPQFTVKLIDNSYDIPPSTTTIADPYTGKETTITNTGNHITDRSIEVTIENQPFTPYTDANNYRHELRYIVQFKGHFEENWRDFPSPNRRTTPSNSQYTVILASSNSMYGIPLNSLAAGSQLDFRVQAVDGYLKSLSADDVGPLGGTAFIDDVYSSWSNVKTITIHGESPVTPPTQTNFPSPSISDSYNPPQQKPWQSSYLIVILVTVCILTIPIAIITYINKQRKNRFLNDE